MIYLFDLKVRNTTLNVKHHPFFPKQPNYNYVI